MKRLLMLACWALLSMGCARNIATSPNDTGGGGISRYEGHSARKQDASGTGSSAGSAGSGAVPGSAVQDAGANADSASDSNGGQGTKANPNALL